MCLFGTFLHDCWLLCMVVNLTRCDMLGWSLYPHHILLLDSLHFSVLRPELNICWTTFSACKCDNVVILVWWVMLLTKYIYQKYNIYIYNWSITSIYIILFWQTWHTFAWLEWWNETRSVGFYKLVLKLVILLDLQLLFWALEIIVSILQFWRPLRLWHTASCWQRMCSWSK